MSTFAFSLTINWFIVLALVAMVVGFVVAGAGLVAAADPEGRGGSYLPLIPVGGIVFLCGAGYCLYRLGAVFGAWS
ncbi:MAG: hypothetical protein PHY45_02380 [Rhodocyclaceae bacterium]|nr:hypothetical protein [Rhodocyclaceae bacterium]